MAIETGKVAYITRLIIGYGKCNYSEQRYDPPCNTPRLVNKLVRVSLEACNIIVTHDIGTMSHTHHNASVLPLLKAVCTILLVAAEPGMSAYLNNRSYITSSETNSTNEVASYPFRHPG